MNRKNNIKKIEKNLDVFVLRNKIMFQITVDPKTFFCFTACKRCSDVNFEFTRKNRYQSFLYKSTESYFLSSIKKKVNVFFSYITKLKNIITKSEVIDLSEEHSKNSFKDTLLSSVSRSDYSHQVWLVSFSQEAVAFMWLWHFFCQRVKKPWAKSQRGDCEVMGRMLPHPSRVAGAGQGLLLWLFINGPSAGEWQRGDRCDDDVLSPSLSASGTYIFMICRHLGAGHKISV